MIVKGCDLCSDFPAHLVPRCHPSAPLRAEMTSDGKLVLYCYLPECGREVTRLQVSEPER
jgi:hypothetical protein